MYCFQIIGYAMKSTAVHADGDARMLLFLYGIGQTTAIYQCAYPIKREFFFLQVVF